jgi:MFS family permease
MREALSGLRAAFRNRSIRRLQLAEIGSTTGTWAYTVALAVFAYGAGGVAAVGVVTVIRSVPSAVLAPFVALLADRHSRRRVMLASDLIAAAALGGMAVVALSDAPAGIVYGLAGCASIAGAAFTPARAALLPSLAATPEELTAANTAASTIESVGSFAGPAIGGVIVSVWDPAAGFLFTAAMYSWSALNTWLLAPDSPPSRVEEPNIVAEATAGIRTIVRDRRLRLIVGLYGAQTLVAGALDVLVVVLAFQILGGGEGQVGTLFAAVGVGGLVGAAVVLPVAAGHRLAFAFALGNALWAIPLIAIGLTGSEPATLVAFAVIGIANTVVDVAALTLLQRAVPDEVLARVFGALEGLIVGAVGIGGALAPVMVSLLGGDGAAIAFGSFLLAATLVAWARLRAIDSEAEPPPGIEMLRRVPIFAPLPEPAIEHLAGVARPLEAAGGSEIVRTGEPGDRFYVILDGEVTVQTAEGEAILGPGEFFGEIALLRDVPRTATVRARGDVRLLTIRRDDFIAAVTGHAPSASAAEAIVVQRLEGLRGLR